jgi:hypothetical protein
MDDLSAFDIGIEPWVADAGKSRHRRAVVIGPRVWFCDPRRRCGIAANRLLFLANAEHWRAPRAVNAVPRAVVVQLHPFASTRGRSSGGGAPRLQRGTCGFDSHRLHQRLRSVNGKHAPFVRPRCGFNSCRRLQHADVAQSVEHRAANPVRPVRSGSSASQVRGVTGSTASSNLAGPGSIPGGPAFEKVVADYVENTLPRNAL